MKPPLLKLAECAVALLLAFPLALLAVYGVTAYADDRDTVTLLLAGMFALLGACTFLGAMRCVGQGRPEVSLEPGRTR